MIGLTLVGKEDLLKRSLATCDRMIRALRDPDAALAAARDVDLHARTMGGGFGLTKAFLVTKQFGGRFWIASEVGVGTRIRIQIPRPAAIAPAATGVAAAGAA